MWGTPFCGNILGFALALQASRGLGARPAGIALGFLRSSCGHRCDSGLALRASLIFGETAGRASKMLRIFSVASLVKWIHKHLLEQARQLFLYPLDSALFVYYTMFGEKYNNKIGKSVIIFI